MEYAIALEVSCSIVSVDVRQRWIFATELWHGLSLQPINCNFIDPHLMLRITRMLGYMRYYRLRTHLVGKEGTRGPYKDEDCNLGLDQK